MSVRHKNSIRSSIVLVAIAAVALTACGGSDAKAGVASLSNDSKTSGSKDSDAASSESFRTQLLAYAKCMRENGIDFPDPQFDSNGRPQFNRQGGEGFGALRDNPGFEKAQTACESKRPDFAGQFQQTPEQQAQTRKDLLKFAKCMRGKGIDFPDPTFDANGRPQFNRDGAPGGAQGQNRNDEASRTAREACQQEVGGNFGGRPGGGGGFGRGPGGGGPGGDTTGNSTNSSTS